MIGNDNKPMVIRDIAKNLNVSTTTVSFIVNGKAREKRISRKLEAKVLEYVKKVKFTPNHIAKSLRTGKTNLIGLIVEDISNPFYANLARQIEDKAFKNGFRLFYCSSENSKKKEKELIRVLKERKIEGYIITPTNGITEELESLLQENLSVVLFDRYIPGLKTNYVGIDNFVSSYNAIEHLISEGFNRIACITTTSTQVQMKERLMGYEKAISDHHLESFIKKVPFHTNYTEKIAEFLKTEKKIDAAFFSTNYLAVSGLQAIKSLEKRIPEDIAVVAFDDRELFSLYSPSITAISQPIEKLSAHLINILLADIKNPNTIREAKEIMLPATLIIRESSRKKQRILHQKELKKDN